MRNDRDHKQSEIKRLLHFYDHDLDDRDNEIELLQTQVIEMHEKLMVCRAERTEAYDERDGLLQQTYQQAQSMETCATKLLNVENENKKLREKCQILEEQVKIFYLVYTRVVTSIGRTEVSLNSMTINFLVIYTLYFLLDSRLYEHPG